MASGREECSGEVLFVSVRGAAKVEQGNIEDGERVSTLLCLVRRSCEAWKEGSALGLELSAICDSK